MNFDLSLNNLSYFKEKNHIKKKHKNINNFYFLSLTLNYISRFIKQYFLYFKYLYLLRNSPSFIILNRKKGFINFKSNPKLTFKIYRLFETYIKRLNSGNLPNRKNGLYDQAFIFNSSKDEKLILSIDNLIRQQVKYYDKNTKFLSDFYLHSCTLHLSLPNDSHHFDITGHTKQISKLHQMHYDPDPGNIKLIYYLSDVLVEDEGPFSYVRGSSSSVPLIKKISGASLCGLVNFNNKTSVKFLKSLPNSLKFFNIIGSLVNDHEINKSRFLTTLLNNEIKFYSDKSDIIFFDPQGFHRGGFCMNKKSRLNIQCIFKRSY